ncbi:hydantoinase/oxoprolinase family protein [Candidatus Bathyarchaeota archaeon]|nr:hydantoinase/oxoprolinase family protein [Candidatus Bathyarchaeota archaeon]
MDYWRIGIDIGGAFTDLYAASAKSGENIWVKVESTPPNFEEGVLKGIMELERSGVHVRDAAYIIHGQTVVVNTIITRSGARVGFITTEGFDTMEIQRANRRDLFNFRYRKPLPFVSKYMTTWVNERMDSDGSIYKPLNESETERAVNFLLNRNAESLAIGFINSYVNPDHEVKTKEIAKRILKERGIEKPFITISSDLSREWREYERFSTAVLNAYVQPVFVRYLEKLESILRKKGFHGIFYITLSSGGVVTSEYAKNYPITTIEGGPISGIIGGTRLASLLGIRNIIVIDGGSTTTKAGLAKDLAPMVHTEYWIEQDEWNAGYPLRVPTLDIHEVGLGGTSIIWVDDAGNLRVGPEAAGARPGPACYGVSGSKPTLTDAYVVAGYLNPKYLLGGRLRIFKDKAFNALRDVAESLGLDADEAAYGAIRVANDLAANLIRQISVKKGYDPREFTLVAHGGAGPMFAPFIAEELQVSSVMVPTIPSGVFNAWGMIGLDIRHEIIQTNMMLIRESEDSIYSINRFFEELENKVKEIFRDEGIDPRTIEIMKYLDMRYEGQAHALKIQCLSGKLRRVEDVAERFHEEHYNEYGFNLPKGNIEIVNFHVVGVHRVTPPNIEKRAVHGSLKDAHLGEREVYMESEEVLVPIYKKENLPSDAILKGPCIIESDTSTVIVTQGFKAIHDEYGNIILIKAGVDSPE